MKILIRIMITIIGLILGLIIGYILFDKKKYIGPNSNEMMDRNKIYKDKKGEFRYKAKITICPMNYSMKKLHDKNFKERH